MTTFGIIVLIGSAAFLLGAIAAISRRELPLPPVELKWRTGLPTDQITVICCECGRHLRGPRPARFISHGICDSCLGNFHARSEVGTSSAL